MLTIVDDQAQIETYGMLVPVFVSQKVGQPLQIETYAQTAPIAHAYETRFSQAPFSEIALKTLDEMLLPYFAQHGAKREDADLGVSYFVYTLSQPPQQISNAHPAEQIVFLLPEQFANYQNLTDFSPAFDDQQICALLADGKIIGIAAQNPTYAGIYEISVDVAPAYAGAGRGTFVAYVLAKHAEQEGKKVCYVCAANHKASCRIAEKLGMSVIEQFYSAAAQLPEKGEESGYGICRGTGGGVDCGIVRSTDGCPCGKGAAAESGRSIAAIAQGSHDFTPSATCRCGFSTRMFGFGRTGKPGSTPDVLYVTTQAFGGRTHCGGTTIWI